MLDAFRKPKESILPERKGRAECFVDKSGLMQNITVQMIKTEGQGDLKTEEIHTYQLNPFLGKFDGYDGKVKPEA